MVQAVKFEVESNGVGRIQLNRPERKNAITGPLGLALADALQRAANDERVRVILLHGAGGAFCSGLDLKEFNADPPPAWLSEFQHIWRGAHRALFESPKPIIGALERYAINGGAALALACDLLVVGEEAFLQVGEVQIGMAAPYNMAWLSLRHPESIIAELTLIGDRWPGPMLRERGIATACVADAEVMAQAGALAARLAGFPEQGLRRIRGGLRARLSDSADAWFDRFTGRDPVGSAPKPKRVG